MITAPVPAEQIERNLRELDQRIANLPTLPNLQVLEQRVQKLTTETLLNPACRGDLIDADQDIKNYHKACADRAQLNADRVELQRALNEQQAVERRDRADAATKRMQQARDEFFHAAKLLCRAYKKCLSVQRTNQHIPGAAAAIPRDFHISDASPISWQGTTAQHIRDGSLSWLNKEQEAA